MKGIVYYNSSSYGSKENVPVKELRVHNVEGNVTIKFSLVRNARTASIQNLPLVVSYEFTLGKDEANILVGAIISALSPEFRNSTITTKIK